MTLKEYKGYTIRVAGIGHSIFRPGQDLTTYPPGYEMSWAAVKRWINDDITYQKVRSL